MDHSSKTSWHGTTILCLRKGGRVIVAGDGQVSMGQTVIKSNARKLRRLAGGSVIAGFAGATADAITLFERLEGKLEQYAGQLPELFVVSQVEPDHAARPELDVKVSRAAGTKCERCWRYTTDVGSDSRFPTVCGRCGRAVAEILNG